MAANKLSNGEPLRTADGTLAVAGGGTTPKVRDGWMWDLTVPGNNDHDFYVVAAPSLVAQAKQGAASASILVHNTNYGAGGGCFSGALQAMERAVALNKMTRGTTTAVVRVRNLLHADPEGNPIEQTWVTSSQGRMPTSWKNPGVLNPDEVFKLGPTGRNAQRAEQTSVDYLFNSEGMQEWGIIEGGTSSGMCYATCYPMFKSSDLTIGYDGYSSMKPDLYSPYRLFYSR